MLFSSQAAGLEDLLALCRSLNEAGAMYMTIGGIAIIQHGKLNKQ